MTSQTSERYFEWVTEWVALWMRVTCPWVVLLERVPIDDDQFGVKSIRSRNVHENCIDKSTTNGLQLTYVD